MAVFKALEQSLCMSIETALYNTIDYKRLQLPICCLRQFKKFSTPNDFAQLKNYTSSAHI